MDSRVRGAECGTADRVSVATPEKGGCTPVTTVLLVESQSLVRDMLAQYLGEHWPRCAIESVEDTAGLVTALGRRPEPDVALLGEIAGAEAESLVPLVARLREAAPHCAIAVYAPVHERRAAARLIAAGASGILPKRLGRDSFLAALDLVVLGEIFVPWELQQSPARAHGVPT